MKKLATALTLFCVCILFMGAAKPYAVPLSVGENAANGVSVGQISFIVGIALLVVIVLRGWRINAKARKKYAESERKAYSYVPRAERVDRSDRVELIRSRAALEDMDFPSGFGGIHNTEQLDRNRALYQLYSESTDDYDGWDDARR